MNILIVDDELYSVEGIAASLNWNKLGINGVYTAYSMQQAQEIFREVQVDLMVCDIEMPKGSGIDLMEWVQTEKYNTVCIFLTCYSKFEYTSRAISLQIFDYILKPADYTSLEKTISKAVDKVLENRKIEQYQEQAQYWTDARYRIISEFWTRLISGDIAGDKEKIRSDLKRQHLNENAVDEPYYLLLIQAIPDKGSEFWEENLLRYAQKNILQELLNATALVQINHTRLCLSVSANDYSDKATFFVQCEKVINTLSRVLSAEFSIYFDGPCVMEQVYDVYTKLEQDAKSNLSLCGIVFQHGDKGLTCEIPEIPEKEWQEALLNQNTELIWDNIQEMLNSGGHNKIINHSWLRMIYHNLLNVIYSVLDTYHLPAHQPFLEEDSDIFENAFNSIPDFQIWVREILKNCINLFSINENPQSFLATVRSFIREHLDSNLSRTTLASIVHLNPDYLSYLFKEKSGSSLSEYIIQERLSAAKTLLITTDLPVHEIAIRTGFQSISYFSKQFKRIEQKTPMQYRKQQKS